MQGEKYTSHPTPYTLHLTFPMSLFNDDRYTWRETYFVLFEDFRRRPSLDSLRRELQRHGATLKILGSTTNPAGRLRTLTVASYEDHSALEIVFRQGSQVAVEAGDLIRSIEKGCTAKERERLHTVKHWTTKFDVLHFEQTAGTAEFKAVKLPVLKFQASRSEAPKGGPFARRPQFRFDPDSYENCLAGGVGDEYTRKDDEIGMDDSGMFERVDPDTLILVLDTLCHLTGGVAIDPASGVIIDN